MKKRGRASAPQVQRKNTLLNFVKVQKKKIRAALMKRPLPKVINQNNEENDQDFAVACIAGAVLFAFVLWCLVQNTKPTMKILATLLWPESLTFDRKSVIPPLTHDTGAETNRASTQTSWTNAFQPSRPAAIHAENKALPSCREEETRQALERMFAKPFPKARPNFLRNPETGRNLELDCFNAELKLAAEFNGSQHAIFPNRFHRTRREFDAQQRRDRYKATVCKQQGITLLVVPHTIVKGKIEAFIKHCLLTQTSKTHRRELYTLGHDHSNSWRQGFAMQANVSSFGRRLPRHCLVSPSQFHPPATPRGLDPRVVGFSGRAPIGFAQSARHSLSAPLHAHSQQQRNASSHTTFCLRFGCCPAPSERWWAAVRRPL